MRSVACVALLPMGLLLLLPACTRASADRPARSASPAGAAPVAATSAHDAAPPTTAPELALGNLEGELAAADQMLAKDPRSLAALTTLSSLHLMHGQLLGHLAEYDRAEALAERAVALWPRQASAWMAHAAVRSRFHRFDAALADLARALELGGDEVEISQRRAAILQATGRLQAARPVIEKLARGLPSLETIGTLAMLEADEGHVEAAERGFVEALQHFRSVSPFPLTWLWLQQATMWQQAGAPARADELLEAAHARMPVDVAILSHLAGGKAILGDRAVAIALLRDLTERSDDPEYPGQLAELLGPTEEAARLRVRAAGRYEELLARHPDAFADHAARFYLAAGLEPARALALAERNLEVRKTGDAYALVVEAALAAKKPRRACEVTSAALAAGVHAGKLPIVGWRAFTACGRSDRAQALLQASNRPVR